jgi:rhomboid protease GluP
MNEASGGEDLEELALLPVPRGGRKRADEWALVLASQAISVRVLLSERGWMLEVPRTERSRAEASLAAYTRESREAARARRVEEQASAEFIPRGPLWAGLPVAITLLAIFAYGGDRADGGLLFARGSARAHLIIAGEWWRCITALFLHSNFSHVLSNCFAGLFFIGAVCRILGLGLGIFMVLAAGALGNGLNALLQPPMHNSVGASTAVFGSIGLLVGLSVVRRYRSRLRRKHSWVPIGAGLALLGMLGTAGERVDLWAHFFGFAAGVALGIGMVLGRKEAPSSAGVQWLLGTAAVLAILLSWVAAGALGS